jgi:hypothetical protein
MTASKTEITRADIMDMDAYGKVRAERRRAVLPAKKLRRVPIGPYATFYFESYDTMWLQVHEMLFIERGGEDQIEDELSAYNPLIPKGNELVATVMFEIDDPVRRKTVLGKLGGVEETMTLDIGGDKVTGVPEADVDRTTADGKASSVQFVHFPLTDAQAAAFKAPGTRVVLAIEHPEYPHMSVLSDDARAELATDL